MKLEDISAATMEQTLANMSDFMVEEFNQTPARPHRYRSWQARYDAAIRIGMDHHAATKYAYGGGKIAILRAE